MTVRELLLQAQHSMGGSEASRLEAEVLLAHVLDTNRAFLYANPDYTLPAQRREAFQSLVSRRAGGTPVAYLTGRREFWSLPLRVTPDVLIPRPETELLVEAALEFLPPDTNLRVADLGTGSGAVALAIATERPRCELHATDISAAAIAVARHNVQAIAPGRVLLHQGSWLEPLQGRFRLIVCNPPYVPADDPHLQQGDCRFEPDEALTPGTDGMAAIRHITHAALPRLEAGGMLAFEHGYDQGEAARALLQKLGYREVETLHDMEGRERITRGLK